MNLSLFSISTYIFIIAIIIIRIIIAVNSQNKFNLKQSNLNKDVNTIMPIFITFALSICILSIAVTIIKMLLNNMHLLLCINNLIIHCIVCCHLRVWKGKGRMLVERGIKMALMMISYSKLIMWTIITITIGTMKYHFLERIQITITNISLI